MNDGFELRVGLASLMLATCLVLGLVLWLAIGLAWRSRQRPNRWARRPLMCKGQGPGQAKPPWVAREVLRLNDSLNGDTAFGTKRRFGYRKIAAHFNALHHATQMRVSRGYVAKVIARAKLQALERQQALKHAMPPPLERLRIWALDATTLATPRGNRIAIGIVDHGSRVLVALQAVASCNAWVALAVLGWATVRWGRPTYLRTDNAAVFHSRVWRVGLQLLGIKRQFTQPGSPWQNGRIERLFGTLKDRWHELAPALQIDVQWRLSVFTDWYNGFRPHQHLYGAMPLQAWHDEDGPPIRWRVRQWWGGALRAVQRE